MLRRGERTEQSIIENLAGRLRNLENAATRRMLPPNYEFVYDQSTDQLLVRRVSDGATAVIL